MLRSNTLKPDQNGLRRVFCRPKTACLLACLFFIGLPDLLVAQQGDSETVTGSQEYFLEQNPDTIFVIKTEAFETEFQTTIYDDKDRPLISSGFPQNRLGALYQLVELPNERRRLRIETILGRGTDRSDHNMEVIRFSPGGPDQTVLIQAYRMLSSGLEIETSVRPEAWQVKIGTLMQSATIFDQLGMMEMNLWAKYFAHHLMHIRLNDQITAAEGAKEIVVSASRSPRLKELVLGALQLEASALASQVTARAGSADDSQFKRAQELFQQAAELSIELDLRHEHAMAVYHSGLTHEQAGQLDIALAKFEETISIATANGNTALANQVRQHAAELQESLGNNAEAISLMRQISPEASAEPAAESLADVPTDNQTAATQGDERADREMVTYLYEQGRLLEKTYQHAEAAKVLQQALDLNQKAASRIISGPVSLLLADALYSAGKTDEALENLLTGLKKTPSAGHDQSLQMAYGLLAEIQRSRGDYAAMNTARSLQDQFISTALEKAGHIYQSALDHLAQHGPDARETFNALKLAEQEAKQSNAYIMQRLAMLQRCALGKPFDSAASSCSSTQAKRALSDILASGFPIATHQARLLWSQILFQNGQSTNALSEIDDLIEDMRFYQTKLPGVLGAWYWQNHEHVFAFFMELTIEQASTNSSSASQKLIDLKSLAALNRLTNLSNQLALNQVVPEGADFRPSAESEELKQLRSLIAARETAPSQRDANRLAAEILRLQDSARANMSNARQSTESLSRQLQRLTDDQALLTYYFASDKIYAWVGKNDGLTLIEAPWSEAQSEKLSQETEGLRWDSTSGGEQAFIDLMDRMGTTLLTPVANLLPRIIYFVPSGRMEGFPLDALRLNGNFLAERHKVINVLSLESLTENTLKIQKDSLSNLFLAGNQKEQAGDFGIFQPPSVELRQVAELFIGPGLHIVQGAALHWDEFQSERFTRAGAAHLAIPGNIDLRQPEESKLFLSDNAESVEHEFLLPQDFAPNSLNAEMIVLSRTEFIGNNPSAFHRNTRFILEFLNAGANSVLASLWSVGDEEAAQFMEIFYQQLASNPDVGEALFATKRYYLAANQSAGNNSWAAFQLFTR